jgi:pimeloyl-ACP methyl ester carboxylesterase
MRTSITLTLAFVALASVASYTQAAEIQYGSLKGQFGDTLHIEYRGPSGPQHFTCTTAGACTPHGTTTPQLTPTLLGSTSYEHSADGRLAVRPFTVGAMTYHFLYDISVTPPRQIALIPFMRDGATIYFSRNNDAVVFREGLTFTRYEITTRRLATLTLDQSLAFLSISPSANYVTGYNYTTLRHEFWRFSDGSKLNGPDSMQSYIEFSEDESRFAFLEDVESFKTLYTMHTRDLGQAQPASLQQVTQPATDTEDYLFLGTTLYFLGNVSGPLNWDLWSFDGETTTLADTDVSYGDFLKRVRTDQGSQLAYLKNEGRNSHVHLLSHDSEEITRIRPVADSPKSDAVAREVRVYGERTGVLLSPERPARNPDLFIWMHGGPQRQVAVEYHPYLSYAVYDELLERFAEGGHYVYKIDYTGSSGYGANFRKALHMRIGDVEMQDVRNAIRDIERDIEVRNVYLIGNSYGGYMALRGVVDLPERIDGAISINGVSDWYGLIQQIPSSPFRTLFEGVPDLHNLAAYFQASVFTGMDKLTTDNKVLVVWGENDSTVPVWQSTKYVEFANTVGIDVRSLAFPDEDHILRKRENLDTLCTTIVEYLNVPGVKCKL